MPFGLFKKKKEMVDLRPRDSNMPIPAKIKERLLAGTIVPSSNSSSTNTTQNSGGGFFSFFGADNSSAVNPAPSASSSEIPATSSITTSEETKTDFWGNPVNTGSSSSSSLSSDLTNTSINDNQFSDVAFKLSRMTDRVELLERKIDRLQRKLGISGGEY